MKRIKGKIIAKPCTDKVCPQTCIFSTKLHINPPTPCHKEVIPFLTKFLGLPKCSDGFIYMEEG